jgi:PAS domain S-box-containing protein
MISKAQFEKIKASGHLPIPKGVALRVIQLTQKDNVTNQEVAQAIKSDPALTGHIIKVANARVAYQTRPVVSLVDAVAVLGLNSLRQLVLGLSLMESNSKGTCKQFDYQGFWASSLLTALTAKNLVLHSNIGSTEEVFILGLLGQIGSLALATAYPQEYGRLLVAAAENADSENAGSSLNTLEQAEFGFDHNQLTQAMLADWSMPRLFQEIALHHENPSQAKFMEGSRDWRLLNVMHLADYFATVCLAQGAHRRKMVSQLILIAARTGVELDSLTALCDKSVNDWHEWCKLCGIPSIAVPHFVNLLESLPQASEIPDTGDESAGGSGTTYKLRILLVDDDRAIKMLLKMLMEKAGHTVVTASNGIEGLSLIEEFMPQLIVTDWIMPEMDGLEFCKAVRMNSAWRNIYMFIITAQESTDRLVEAFEAGANDYITKPINQKVLRARLRAAQRVVQLQEEAEFDRKQLHKFTDELAAFNHKLRKSEASMHAILDNSPYMTWLKDAEGRYIKVNKNYVDYVRMKDIQQVIGKTDFDLWPKELAEKYRGDDTEVMASRQQKHTEEPSLDSDKMHWVETFKTPVIDENGNMLGTTGFARDITRRKEHEEELKRSNAELEQFSYAVSHDMRQPLRMISSYLQLLEIGLVGQLDTEKREYFNFAIDGAKRIDQMLMALLEYSRVGMSSESMIWIESRAVLDEALLFLQPAIAEAQAKLTISGDWPRIMASHDEILRLLQNLIGNAAKYRIAGRIPEITVTSELARNEWHLNVADNGVGIISSQIDRLFKVFQRLHNRTAYEGTGIGLALCRKIAEHHKGRIWAESEGEGLGSKFCVVLPAPREKI